MDKLENLRTQFIAIQQKTRAGDIFQSIGEVLSDTLTQVKVQPKTPVQLPENGDDALAKMKAYSQRLDNHRSGDGLDMVSDADLHLAAAQLANPLPKYRDTGAFFFLSDVIQNDLLSDEQMRWLTSYLISDDVLFSHIFEPNNAAIYQRSFSILVLSLLLFTQRTKSAFMAPQQLAIVINQIALYVAIERDTRGFIGTNGWAHAFTHIGNAVAEILMMPQLLRADKLFLLASMLAGYRELQQSLNMGETERLVEVTMYSANEHPLYHDYILLTLKLWRKDLVTRQPPQNEGRWHQMYNRARFFNAIILRGKDNVPEKIFNYVSETRDFLT